MLWNRVVHIVCTEKIRIHKGKQESAASDISQKLRCVFGEKAIGQNDGKILQIDVCTIL